MSRMKLALVTALAVSGCALDDEPAATTGADDDVAARRDRDVRIQPGTSLIPLAITEDDYVFYQDGASLYVTSLEPGAPRVLVATIPNANTAYIYTSGKVAFIWTNPDYTSPSYGVSPLTIWTARHGAHEVSTASPIGTLTTAASRDGRRAVFPANASAGGTVGDLVEVTTDLATTRTLATGVQTDYSNGPCRPLAAYLGQGQGAYPAIAYCAGTDATSTLTTFRPNHRFDLTGLTNPPRLFADQDGRRLLTTKVGPTVRSGNPILVTEQGATTIEDVRSSFSFFNHDGSAIYLTIDQALNFSMRRASFKPQGIRTTEVVPPLAAIFGGGFGSQGLTSPITSRDGRWLAYGAGADPATGNSDVTLAEVRSTTPRQVVIEPDLVATTVAPVEPFTDDSRFVIYGVPDATTGTIQVYGAPITGGARVALGGPSAAVVQPAEGSHVIVADNPTIDPNNFFLSTADLKVTDPACSHGDRLVAAQANLASYITRNKQRLVYATNDAGRAGLRVVRID